MQNFLVPPLYPALPRRKSRSSAQHRALPRFFFSPLLFAFLSVLFLCSTGYPPHHNGPFLDANYTQFPLHSREKHHEAVIASQEIDAKSMFRPVPSRRRPHRSPQGRYRVAPERFRISVNTRPEEMEDSVMTWMFNAAKRQITPGLGFSSVELSSYSGSLSCLTRVPHPGPYLRCLHKSPYFTRLNNKTYYYEDGK